MKRWIVIAGILTIAGACRQGNTWITKAHILERRALANGKVRLNYIFATQAHTIVEDSTDVDSQKIVPHDSVGVKFSVKDPHRNQLQLP